jgi:hypothetical protein
MLPRGGHETLKEAVGFASLGAALGPTEPAEVPADAIDAAEG